MRILYLIDSLNIGGAEMLLYGMLEAYLKSNNVIEVAYFTDGPLREKIIELGIPVHRISRKGLKDPFVILRTIQLIKEMKPDVVHTHLSKSDFSGQFSAAIMQVPARILTIHNTDPWRKNQVYSGMMRFITSGCHNIIAVSPIVRDYIVHWSGYPADKVVVIENGIDLLRFNNASVRPINKSQHWGIPEGNPTVGIIGRLHPQKGHNIFLRAAKFIVEKNSNVNFVVIGDGSLRQELEDQTRNLELDQHVKFAGNENNMPAALASLDLVIFSSHFEGLPVALLEAMAMERPIISTAVGGIPSVISDGQDGFLIPPQSPEILAERSIETLENPELAHDLGQNARNKIQDKYDALIMQEKIMAVYQSLLHKDNSLNKQWI